MNKFTRLMAVVGTATSFVFAGDPALAQNPLPALINFDADTPGAPPTTGGVNQPTTLSIPPGGTILVQSSANGINTQPVVITVIGPSIFGDVGINIDPVTSGTVRVEATVSFDRLTDGFFLQTKRVQFIKCRRDP